MRHIYNNELAEESKLTVAIQKKKYYNKQNSL